MVSMQNLKINGGLTICAELEENGQGPEADSRIFTTQFAWNEDDFESVSMTAQGIAWKCRFRDREAEDPNTPEVKKYIEWVNTLIARGSHNKNRFWILPDQNGVLKIEEQKGAVAEEGTNLMWNTERTFAGATLKGNRTLYLNNGASGRDAVLIVQQNNVGGHKLSWAANQIKFPAGFDSSVSQDPNSSTIFYFRFDGVYWHYVAGGIVQEPKLSDPATKNFADDAAAALGGVPVGGFYHNAGALRVRLT